MTKKQPEPIRWKDPVVENHIRQFPIATAQNVLDRLFLEHELKGGFDDPTTAAIFRLYARFSLLVERLDHLHVREIPSNGSSNQRK